jgi:hypothetical protein
MKMDFNFPIYFPADNLEPMPQLEQSTMSEQWNVLVLLTVWFVNLHLQRGLLGIPMRGRPMREAQLSREFEMYQRRGMPMFTRIHP